MHELYSMLEAFCGVDTCDGIEALLLVVLILGFESLGVKVPEAIAVSYSPKDHLLFV